MKKWILLLFVSIVVLGPVAFAATDELHGTIDLTYASKFMWRGYDAYDDDHSAIQPSIDLDLFGTGFGFTLWSSRANQSGFENNEWLSYTIYYKNLLWQEEKYATAYKTGYTYYSYPDSPREGGPTGADGHAQ